MAKTQNGNGNGKAKLKRKEYEKEVHRLQAQLCRLQEWVKFKGLRVVVVFEGELNHLCQQIRGCRSAANQASGV